MSDSSDPSGRGPNATSRATIAMADHMVSGDVEREGSRWMSPNGLAASRESLVGLLDEHGPADSVRIADLGCGDGRLAVELAASRPNGEVVAVDVSPRARLETQHRLAEAAGSREAFATTAAVGGDATRLLDHLEPFDVIYGINFLQDTDDPVATGRAIRSALVEDGLAVLTVPGEESIERMESDLFATRAVEVNNDEIELPYMTQELAVDGELLEWGQYVFPREQAREFFTGLEFEIVERDSVPVDARGMTYVARELLDEPELAAETSEIADYQRSDPEVGPTVDVYVLRSE